VKDAGSCGRRSTTSTRSRSTTEGWVEDTEVEAGLGDEALAVGCAEASGEGLAGVVATTVGLGVAGPPAGGVAASWGRATKVVATR
jgi:hypothetical protein